jgi:hypothetical protein
MGVIQPIIYKLTSARWCASENLFFLISMNERKGVIRGCRKLRTEFHTWYTLLNIIKDIKLGTADNTHKVRNVYQILVQNPADKRPLQGM